MAADPAPAPAGERQPASDLISVLRDKAPRIALALAAGQMAWPLVRTVRTRTRELYRYTVTVPGDDELYDDLHEWVLSLLPPGEQRALVAWSARRYRIVSSDEQPAMPELRLRYDGAREQSVAVGSHKVAVVVSDETGSKDQMWKPPAITFTASSPVARDALLAEIAAVQRASHARKRKPAFRMLDKWGDWYAIDDLPARGIDSVILAHGQMERLTADMTRFLAAEADYARRGIPWHRGYLFEGPPGTGKTSAALALASHFGMDVSYLPLADVRKDGDLLRNVSRISPRSVLLLEDADVFHAATKRDDDADVTLSGLLNTLDGVATPHGLVTVLTTNTPDVLDPAVVRAGRIDLTEHFGLADADQAGRLISRYYGQPVAVPGELCGISPAEVVEACKRHDDPAAAVIDLAALAVVAC